MSKKKIIISNYDDIKNPDYAGGGAVVIHKVAKYLSKKYCVTLITGKYPGSKDEIVEGVKYQRIGSYVFGGKIGHLFYLFVLPFETLRQKCDLWIDSFTPPFSVSLVPIFLGKSRVIGMVHMLSGKDMKRKYKLPFDIVERLGLKLYKHFIVLTEQSKYEILRSNPNADIKVIPNGIDIPSKKYLYSKKIKQILFLGRLEVDQKGLDLLLKVYSKVSESMDIKLVIAGTGTTDNLEKLHKLIMKSSLKEKISLAGRVCGKEKYRLLRESSIVVVPSRFETFSLTALEALANKTVLFTFDIDGFKWIPENVAVKTKCFNTDEMADKIIKLLHRPSVRKKYEDSGCIYTRKYFWKNIFSMYIDVIKDLI